MLIRVEITQVQHVERLSLALDLSLNKLTCIVGKNGVGKTTLVRAFRNLSHSDTFLRTASRGIFRNESVISYEIGEELVEFTYDGVIDSLNCKATISQGVRTLCAVELPMPYGDRFNFMHSVSEVDRDIRRQIILEEYSRPDELIQFLSDIYSSRKFESLIETTTRGRNYYCILLNDNKYIREDYLSSGEYFLINLYRTIRGTARLIVVDEIDLSLDAAAQVHLVGKLREFCHKYGCSVLFTTHSLAMMRTLDAAELLYMDPRSEGVELVPASYSYIKTLLFGFTGWDRYILTEDPVLQGFLEVIISRYCPDVFFRYKIIHVGGGSQVTNLLDRNRHEHFLSDPYNVIAVLDGDQRRESHAQHASIHFLPIESVEKAVHSDYLAGDFPYRLPNGRGFSGPKGLFKSLQNDRVVSVSQIYAYLCDRNDQAMGDLAVALNAFLSRSA